MNSSISSISSIGSGISSSGSGISEIKLQKLQHIGTSGEAAEGVGSSSGIFRDVLDDVVGQVKETQQDVENKQYLLATGQLEDAHSLPIAEAKAAVSLDLLVALRNKAMDSYSEIMRMSV